MKKNIEQPLDKEGWVTYIRNYKDRIGIMLTLRQAYEDLQHCANPDMNEKAFMAAYKEEVDK